MSLPQRGHLFIRQTIGFQLVKRAKATCSYGQAGEFWLQKLNRQVRQVK